MKGRIHYIAEDLGYSRDKNIEPGLAPFAPDWLQDADEEIARGVEQRLWGETHLDDLDDDSRHPWW